MSRAALLQMSSSAFVEDNLKTLKLNCKRAKDSAVELLVLPENFAFMGKQDEDKLAIAEDYGLGPIQDCLAELSSSNGLWIIAGTVPLKVDAKRVTASCLVYNDKGKNIARYDKIHLFDVTITEEESYQESRTIRPGEKIVVVQTPVGRVGLSVCYDLRFPELYQALREQGAEIFTAPSAFTYVTGKAHWEVLLRARAIENLCYVLAPNQYGRHANGRQTFGHSAIIDPWGTIAQEQAEGDALLIYDIDIEKLQQQRLRFPCHQHHVLGKR